MKTLQEKALSHCTANTPLLIAGHCQNCCLGLPLRLLLLNIQVHPQASLLCSKIDTDESPGRRRGPKPNHLTGPEPFGEYSFSQHEPAAFLTHEKVSHHHDPFRSRPAMLPVAHAAASGDGMNGLRPLPGRGIHIRTGPDHFPKTRIPPPQKGLCDIQG